MGRIFPPDIAIMRTRIILWSVPLVTLAWGCASGPKSSGILGETSKAAINPKLRDELTAMSKADQQARQALIDAGMNSPNEALLAEIARIDSANTSRMKEVVRMHGWPGKSLVGEDGANAAFLLVQHADRDISFQKEVLPLLREAYKARETSGEHLALLTDRVLIAEGKAQLYGSQVEIVDGKILVKPVEDEANLDKRRAELGLQSMNEYIELLRKVYGLPKQKP